MTSPDQIHSRLNQILPVSRETFLRLQTLAEGVRRWQPKTNLIANGTLDELWERHIADSLQCIALKPNASHWVDIGSGGGFPGLVIAACMAETDGSSVHMVESNSKKCAFLRQINRQMGSSAEIHAERIESAAKQIPTPEIVTARALASLPKLLDLASPWLLDGATGLFHKGREFEAEIKECDGLWGFDLVDHSSTISSESVILEISNLRPLHHSKSVRNKTI